MPGEKMLDRVLLFTVILMSLASCAETEINNSVTVPVAGIDSTPVVTNTATKTSTATPSPTALLATPELLTPTRDHILTSTPFPNRIDLEEAFVDERIGSMFSGEFSEHKVVELLYGSNWTDFDRWSNGREVDERVEWDLKAGMYPIRFYGHQDYAEPERVFVKVIYSAPFSEDRASKYLVIYEIAISYDECQFCMVHIGGSVLSHANGNWQVIAHRDSITVAGGWRYGYGVGELVQIGPDKYGYIFERYCIGTGFSEDEVALITDVDGRLQLVFDNIGIAGRNHPCGEDGGMPCWTYDSDLQFVPGNNPDYFDLHLSTSGTVGAAMEEIDSTRTYTFSVQEYVLLSRKDSGVVYPPDWNR
jgi:hypothetical protein